MWNVTAGPVRTTLLASLIQVAGDRTQPLLLVGAGPDLRPTIAVTVPSSITARTALRTPSPSRS